MVIHKLKGCNDNMDKQSRYTMTIHRSTKNRLLELGRMAETYDDLINRLLDELIKHRKNQINKKDLK
jgi:hypothetical protein